MFHSQPSPGKEFSENFLLGVFSGTLTQTILTPYELIVVQRNKEKETIWNRSKLAMTRNGLVVLWRMNFMRIRSFAPIQALNFSIKDLLHRLLAKENTKANNALFLSGNMLSGGLAGVFAMFTTYSWDYAKATYYSEIMKANLNKQKIEFTGALDIYLQTLRKEGIRGLYKGAWISSIGAFVYRALYFGLFDTIIPLLPPSLNHSFCANMTLAVGVTSIARLTSYPCDTVRRTLMVNNMRSGFLRCFVSIIRVHGIKALWKDVEITLLPRSIVAGAAVLAFYNQGKLIFFRNTFIDQNTLSELLNKPIQ